MVDINVVVKDRLCLIRVLSHTERCREAFGAKLKVDKSTVMVVGEMLELGYRWQLRKFKCWVFYLTEGRWETGIGGGRWGLTRLSTPRCRQQIGL